MIPQLEIKRRLKKLTDALDENGIDAILIFSKDITSDSTFKYLVGIDLSYSTLFLDKGGQAKLFVPEMEMERAEKTGFDLSNLNELKKFLKSVEARRIGLLKPVTPLTVRKFLRGKKIVDAYPLISSLRAVKSNFELEKIKESIKLVEGILKKETNEIKPGITELQLKANIECKMLRENSVPAFPSIVLFGRRTSMPHGVPTKKKLRKGEIVLIDAGSLYEGYASDITITIVHTKKGKITHALEVVRNAFYLALDEMQPGKKVSEIAKLVEKYIKKEGYDILHSLGHGIGLDVHEQPSLSSKVTGWKNMKLERNMVLALEPAVYVKNSFGVRLEREVLITKKGAKILTSVKF